MSEHHSQEQPKKQKNNHWLKLPTDFFSFKSIKKVLKSDKHHSAIIFYLQLSLLTVGTDGYYLFDKIEDSLEEELSLELDYSVEKVKKYLEILEKLQLISRNNENIFIQFVQDNTGKKDISNERVARYRQRQSAKFVQKNNDDVTDCNVTCNDDVTDCNAPRVREELDNREEIKLKIDNKEKTKSKKIDKRSYVALFENNNWFDRVRGSRNRKALRKWLTYLEQRGSAIEVIPPISWETKLEKMLKYCGQYDLLSAVELAIDSNWKSLSLDRDYSIKVERLFFIRQAKDRRYELHQRLKQERDDKLPKITFEEYLTTKDPNDPKVIKFKEMWEKVQKSKLEKENKTLLPEIGVDDEE